MKLHYLNKGKGEAALLLHGFLGSAAQWDALARPLSRIYQLIIPELPGHGNSPETKQYTISDVAEALNDIMVHENIVKAHLIGHSMGGYVCSAFAKAYPEKTSSLTLINSIAGADSPERKKMRDRSIKLIKKYREAYTSMAITNLFTEKEQQVHAAKIDEMKEQAAGITTDSILAALIAMRDRPGYRLDNSTLPVNYILGRVDTVIPPYRIHAEAEKLGASLSVILGGHMLIMTHSAKVLDKLRFGD